MIRAAVQLVAGWLAHAEHGVNALAAQLPHTGDAAPPTVVIYNTADHPSVARTFEPPSTPAVVVWGDSTAKTSVRGHHVARDLVVGVAYVTMDDADDQVASAAADYIMRAALLSMARFSQSSIARNDRAKNGVTIAAIGDVDYTDVTGASGRYRVWGLLAIALTAAETSGVSGRLTPAMPAELASA